MVEPFKGLAKTKQRHKANGGCWWLGVIFFLLIKGKKTIIGKMNSFTSFGVEKMTAMLKDESTRKKFVDDSVDFLKKFEFDGLDLDFECNCT